MAASLWTGMAIERRNEGFIFSRCFEGNTLPRRPQAILRQAPVAVKQGVTTVEILLLAHG